MAVADENIIIGVDTGNRCIKTVSHAFVSGLKTFDTRPAFQSNLLEYNGKFFVPSNERIAYLQDKTQSDDYFILSLIAIAKEIETRKIPTERPISILLGVGLPPSHLPRLRDRFRTYFNRGGVTFTFNKHPYAISITDVTVFAQGYAAIFADYETIKKEQSAYIVDIGGYTTDIIALRYGQVDPAFCQSLDFGLIHLYNEIGLHIHNHFGRRPNEDQIDCMLSENTDLIDGMLAIASETAERYVFEMLRRVEELGVDLALNKGIFIGGGAARLENYICNSGLVRNPMFLRDIHANACGYEAFLNSLHPC